MLAAVFYSFAMAAVVAFVAAVTNALGKVSLDAIIQREVPDSLRASAFARSETLLQLAWVVGGALGIALPPTGWIGFTVAAALLVIAVGLVLWGMHRGRSPPVVAAEAPTTPVGTVVVVTRAARSRAGARSSSWPVAAAPRGPGDVRVEVGAQDVAARPVQYCEDGERVRYDNAPPVIEVSPDAVITLTVPEAVAERGWSVQVFDEKLEEILGEVDVPAARTGSPRSTPPTSSRRRSTS